MENDIEKILNELLPPQLEMAKKTINYLLNEETNKRITNLKYLKIKRKIECPINSNHHIKKNGTKNNTQRYFCHNCHRSFSITNKTITNYSTIGYNQLKSLLKCLYDKKPIKEIKHETGLSETSVFELEIRIFTAMEKVQESKLLEGVIQCDEKYIRTSFKGFRPENMPRPSRHDGHSDLTSGISEDQVCVVVAIDSNDTLIIKVVGNSNASSDKISIALKDKIKTTATLVTDSKNSYKKFADENHLKLIQIPSDKHKIDNYTINDVNEIMTEIENYLRDKRGISSRHLQHHLNFIRYRKILKYTIEYLEINETMYQDIIINLPTQLKSNEVYSTDLPFDIDDYKDWYNSHY